MDKKKTTYFYTCASYRYDEQCDKIILDTGDCGVEPDLLRRKKNFQRLVDRGYVTLHSPDRNKLRLADLAYHALNRLASRMPGKAYLFFDRKSGLCLTGLKKLPMLQFYAAKDRAALESALTIADDYCFHAQPDDRFQLRLEFFIYRRQYHFENME